MFFDGFFKTCHSTSNLLGAQLCVSSLMIDSDMIGNILSHGSKCTCNNGQLISTLITMNSRVTWNPYRG